MLPGSTRPRDSADEQAGGNCAAGVNVIEDRDIVGDAIGSPAAALFCVVVLAVVWAAGAHAAEPLPDPVAAEMLPAAAVIPPAPDARAAPACIDPYRADTYDGMMPDRAAATIGVASCATGSCHGGPRAGNHDLQSFAATIWSEDDRHAHAYEVLHSERSRRMARLLGIGPAHRAQQCLACHSMQDVSPQPLPQAVLADGVGCASCHGDSARWQQLHTLASWKTLSPEAREAVGYRDLATPAARARTCVRCHVGDERHEVDHDLIAAGHPRLFFEFAAYQRLEPRHWSPRDKAESAADFTERSWAAGQATALEAVGRLLAIRVERAAAAAAAGERQHWPEFAEFDCYSCHRTLGPDSGTALRDPPLRSPHPGQPSWQPWYAAAARLTRAELEGPAVTPGTAAATLERQAGDLRRLLAVDWPRADEERLRRVLLEARGLAESARRVAAEIDSRPAVVLDGSPATLDAVIAADPPEWRTWDAAVQSYLALEAARAGGPARLGVWRSCSLPAARGEPGQSLDRLRESLRFPPDQDSPGPFDPRDFHRARREVP